MNLSSFSSFVRSLTLKSPLGNSSLSFVKTKSRRTGHGSRADSFTTKKLREEKRFTLIVVEKKKKPPSTWQPFRDYALAERRSVVLTRFVTSRVTASSQRKIISIIDQTEVRILRINPKPQTSMDIRRIIPAWHLRFSRFMRYFDRHRRSRW